MDVDQGYAKNPTDNEAVKEVTLADVRALADDCQSECERRTKRFVEDAGVKPWGFAWYVDWCNEDKRNDMIDKCLRKCKDVATVCPSTESVVKGLAAATKAKEKADAEAAKAAKASAKGKKQSADPEADRLRDNAHVHSDVTLDAAAEAAEITPYRWRRCEVQSQEFTRMLFTLAQKPTKVGFEDRDRDKKRDMMMGGAPTGPTSGNSADWNTMSPMTTERQTPVASRYAGASHQPLPAHMTTHLSEETQEALRAFANPGLKAQLLDGVIRDAEKQGYKPAYGKQQTNL